jgi:5,10-methenyltetrahydrofolate synthetase
MKILSSLLERSELQNPSASDLKRILRRILKAERACLQQNSPAENWGPRQVKSALEYLGLSVENFKDFECPFIASYFPIQSELNLTTYAQKNWLFPKVISKRELRWFRYEDGETGIIETEKGLRERHLSDTFEYSFELPPMVVFVPCIAASVSGLRLGYGGGFYDTFLHTFKAQLVTVACLPHGLLLDELPFEPHDERVDIIVTENQIVEISTRAQLLCKLRT